MRISKEVQEALKNHKPVVALESTIITHGMPYPTNIEVALAVEEEVRKTGAIPLTIAFVDGQLKIGLTKEEIVKLGSDCSHVVKASRRDFGYVMAKKLTASTTVAATMIAADLANMIKAKVVIPTHYGSIVGEKEDAIKFKELVNNKEVKILIK